MRKTKIVLCALFALALILPAVKTNAATLAYDYQVIDQSPSPTLTPGQSIILWLKIKNTGTSAWSSNTLRLGTSHAQDRTFDMLPNSKCGTDYKCTDYTLNGKKSTYAANWIGVDGNRIQMDQTVVNPGETASFGFWITAPIALTSAQTFSEYFQPLVEGTSWMKDAGIHWNIKVSAGGSAAAQPAPQNTTTSGTYNYDIVSQSSYPSVLNPNQTTNVSVDIKNTGTATWNKTGINPVRLGTGSQYGSANQKRDYGSEFANSDWLSTNRPVAIDKNTVAPGETAHFAFTIKAPANPGTYRAYFTPVVDGYNWMKDSGIYWGITVSGTSSPNPNPTPTNLTYAYELVSQAPNSPISLLAGTTVDASIKIKNTGTATWSNTGTNMIVLGWGSIYDNPANQINGFAGGVQAGMVQTQVAPGAIGQFDFKLKAPIGTGYYKAYFTPMVQGIAPQPFKDMGIYWGLNVTNQTSGQTAIIRVTSDRATNGFFSFSGPKSYGVQNATPGQTITVDTAAPTGNYVFACPSLTGYDAMATTSAGYIGTGQITSYLGAGQDVLFKCSYSTSSNATTAPAVPTNLKVDLCYNSTSTRCLFWGSEQRNGISATTELYRSFYSDSGFSLVYSGKEGGYQDSNTVGSTTYYYKARATFDGSNFSNYTSVVTYTPAPGVPYNLQVSSCATSTICVYWSGEIKYVANGVAQPTYELYRSTNQNSAYSQVYTGINNAYNDTGIVPGTIYYYKVRAKYSDSPYSDYSAVASSSIPSIPVAPQLSFDGQSTNTQASIVWSSVAGALSYEIYTDTSATGNFSTRVYQGSALGYIVTGLTPGNTYYYKMRAIGSAGAGPYSSIQNFSTVAKLPTPTNVRSIATTASEIRITWDPVTNATGYAVYRSTSLTGNYISIGATITSGTVFMENASGGLQPGTYYYKVQAVNPSSFNYSASDMSAPITLTLSGILSAPTSLRAIATLGNSLTLAWNASNNATSYELYRSGTLGDLGSMIYTGSSTSYTDLNAIPGNIYYYGVRAKNGTTYSEFSGSLYISDVFRASIPIDVPSNFRIVSTTRSSISIAWDPSINATTYELYRRTGYNGTDSMVYTGSYPYFVDTDSIAPGVMFNIAPGTMYGYKLIAKNPTQSSNYTPFIYGTTLP